MVVERFHAATTITIATSTVRMNAITCSKRYADAGKRFCQFQYPVEHRPLTAPGITEEAAILRLITHTRPSRRIAQLDVVSRQRQQVPK